MNPSQPTLSHPVLGGEAESNPTLWEKWENRLAQKISHLSSPPILGIGGSCAVAYAVATPQAWLWAGLYIVLAVLMPVLWVLHMFRKGEISDLELKVREQRLKPFLLTLTGATAACFLLYKGAAPRPLVVLSGATWVELVLLAAITLRWKISVHCAVAGAVGTLAWELLGSVLTPSIVMPLVAWSRIKLQRHTFAQSLTGLLLGCVVYFLAFFLTGIN